MFARSSSFSTNDKCHSDLLITDHQFMFIVHMTHVPFHWDAGLGGQTINNYTDNTRSDAILCEISSAILNKQCNGSHWKPRILFNSLKPSDT